VFKIWASLIFFMYYPLSASNQNLPDPFDLFKEGLEYTERMNDEILHLTGLSQAEQNQIGAQILQTYKQEKSIRVLNDLRWVRVLQRLKPYLKQQDLAYELFLIDDTTPNAFTFVGGKILIHQGILKYLQSEGLIAALLGHELAHQELLHCAHRVQYSARVAKVDPVLAEGVQLVYSLSRLPFNKEQERKADIYGVTLMEKAGYSRNDAIRLLENLIKPFSNHSNAESLGDFLSTHDSPQLRIQAIKKMPAQPKVPK
jgi:predicted Zn-dependent protease